jgi:hypothetical protein
MWISELLNCGRKMFSTSWRAAARVFRRDRYIFSKVYPPNQNDWTQEDWLSYWMEVRKNVKRLGVPSKRYYYSLTAPEPVKQLSKPNEPNHFTRVNRLTESRSNR